MASTDHSESALALRFNMLAARKTIVRKLVDEHAMRYHDAIDLMCGTIVLSLFRMIQLIVALDLFPSHVECRSSSDIWPMTTCRHRYIASR